MLERLGKDAWLRCEECAHTAMVNPRDFAERAATTRAMCLLRSAVACWRRGLDTARRDTQRARAIVLATADWIPYREAARWSQRTGSPTPKSNRSSLLNAVLFHGRQMSTMLTYRATISGSFPHFAGLEA